MPERRGDGGASDTSRSPYEVLGVPRNAKAEDIRQAYLRAARTTHPDVNRAPSAPKDFADVAAAYQILSDDAKRRAVDAEFQRTSFVAGTSTAGFQNADGIRVNDDPRTAEFRRMLRARPRDVSPNELKVRMEARRVQVAAGSSGPFSMVLLAAGVASMSFLVAASVWNARQR